jgi:hypothetical protein
MPARLTVTCTGAATETLIFRSGESRYAISGDSAQFQRIFFGTDDILSATYESSCHPATSSSRSTAASPWPTLPLVTTCRIRRAGAFLTPNGRGEHPIRGLLSHMADVTLVFPAGAS